MRCAVIVLLALHCLLDHAVGEERRGDVAEEQDLNEGVRVRVATSRADKITGRKQYDRRTTRRRKDWARRASESAELHE